MKRVYVLFVSLFLILFQNCYSQNDSLCNIKAEFKSDKISKDEDYILTVIFEAKSSYVLKVSPKPVVSNLSSKFGDIKIKLEKLSNSCFEEIISNMDPFDIKFYDYKRIVRQSDSIIHRIDIRNLHSMYLGTYRLKVFYSYDIENTRSECQSDWVYFFIKTNKYPRPKISKLFREE